MATDTVGLQGMKALGHQYQLGANMIQRLAADTANLASNKGFSASATGTVTILPRLNVAAITDYPVVAGIVYPIDIAAYAQSTSSPNTIVLFVHRQG